MGKKIDLTGQKFGRLTVLYDAARALNKARMIMWRCLCDCGVETLVTTGELRSGGTKSCGCLRIEKARENVQLAIAERTRHGHCLNGENTSTYHTWQGMIQRCTNPNAPAYEDYGARGITIEDERWYDFVNFLEDMGCRPEGRTLDRIDFNRGYCKQNCRWATPAEQTANRCGTKLNPLKVTEIKRLLKTKMKQKRIASKFGVNCRTISQIYVGNRWAEV
jgi:hypothetical protein